VAPESYHCFAPFVKHFTLLYVTYLIKEQEIWAAVGVNRDRVSPWVHFTMGPALANRGFIIGDVLPQPNAKLHGWCGITAHKGTPKGGADGLQPSQTPKTEI
jgi:hypothetical protein